MESELEPEQEPKCIDSDGHDFRPWKLAPDGTLFFKCPKCKEETE